jgi:hypothetical protein
MFGSEKRVTPERFATDVQNVLGDRLHSLVLYGSTAAGDRIEKWSDHNTLLVAEALGPDELAALAKPVRRWMDAGNPPPRLFTERELRESCDVFPVEMMDMKQSRKVLAGKDVLAELGISRANLRHQVEMELRVKLMGLREGAMLSGCDRIVLANLMLGSCSSILTLFRAALRLYQENVPTDKMAAFEALAKHLPIERAPFEAVVAAKVHGAGLGTAAEKIFASYIRQIETVTEAVDAL